MHCTHCGNQNQQGVKFCASCGTPLQEQPNQRTTYQPPIMQQTGGTREADAEKNKAMAIIAYFIFFIPLIAAPESRFARYHANQGLILLIFSVGTGILSGIISAVLFSSFMISAFAIVGIVLWLIYLALIVFLVLGIVNAAQGKMKPMPVIGSLFTIIK